MKHLLKGGLFSTALLFCTSAAAHYPILDCNVEAEHVACEASFSDRSKAPDVVIEVYSEDDEVLSSGLTNADSRYQFELPEGIFFIIMDAGPGHVIEISSDEVEGI